MKPFIRRTALFGLILAPLQLSAQSAPEFARLIPDAGAVDGLQRIEWQATYAAAGIPITMHSLNRELFFDALVRQGLGANGRGTHTMAEVEEAVQR